MVMAIILIVLGSALLLSAGYMTYIFLFKNRMSIKSNYQKLISIVNFDYIDIIFLKAREQQSIEHNSIQEIERLLNNVKEDFNLLKNDFEEISKEAIVSEAERDEINKLIDKVRLSYLRVNFQINEVLVQKEVSKSVLDEIKTHSRAIVNDYPIKTFTYQRDLEIIQNRIMLIEKNLNDYTNSEFREEVTSLLFLVKKLTRELWILNNLEVELHDKINFFVKKINVNQKKYLSIVASSIATFNKLIMDIRYYEEMINQEISKNKFVFSDQVNKINESFNKINQQFNWQIENYKLLKTNDFKIRELVTNFSKNKDILMSQIINFTFENKAEKLLTIDEAAKKLMQTFKELERFKNESFTIRPPSEFVILVNNIIESYVNYINLIDYTLDDVMKEIQRKENLNVLVIGINNSLLKIEEKLKWLPEKVQLKYTNKLGRYLSVSNGLMKTFRTKVYDRIPDDIKLMIEDVSQKTAEFYMEIERLSFLYKYSESLIILLNKHKSDKQLQEIFDQINSSYTKGELKLLLRLSLKLCEMRNIYE